MSDDWVISVDIVEWTAVGILKHMHYVKIKHDLLIHIL